MTIKDFMKKPNKCLAVAFTGVLISVLVGILTMPSYDMANRSYKKAIKEAGSTVTEGVANAGQSYSDEMQSIAQDGYDDDTYSRSEDAYNDAVAQSNGAIAQGQSKAEAAKEKFAKDLASCEIVSYVAMFLGICSCVWGMILCLKIRRRTSNKVAGTGYVLLTATFALFILSTLISLSSPAGLSFRMMVADDTHADFVMILIMAAMLLFVVGLVLMFIASMKLRKADDRFRMINLASLLTLVCPIVVVLCIMIHIGILTLFSMVCCFAAYVFLIWGWFSVKADVNLNTETDESVKPVAKPKAEMSTPTPKADSPTPKADAPTPSESVAKANSKRTLIIVISIAAVIIVGLSCALFMKSGKDGAAKAIEEAKAMMEENTSENLDGSDLYSEDIVPAQQVASLTEGEYDLTGTIAGKDISGSIYFAPEIGRIQGAYCYGKEITNNMMRLEGGFDSSDNSVKITEYYGDNIVGEWNCKLIGNTLVGTMVNYKGKEYSVDITLEESL